MAWILGGEHGRKEMRAGHGSGACLRCPMSLRAEGQVGSVATRQRGSAVEVPGVGVGVGLASERGRVCGTGLWSCGRKLIWVSSIFSKYK